ncbi:MAG: hypothetical protein RBU25_19510 [Lentisphaeria bacterium]|jgi:hypothetical protein|nr:hypothetical protein [Lentisphaeria bacterium]
MKSPTAAILCLLLALALPAEARWLQMGAGDAPLRRIARTLAADSEGEIKPDARLTPPPEAPAAPTEAPRRRHDSALSAEAAKSKAFAGPGALTALIEVGIEAANVRAADLMPSVFEILRTPDEPTPAPAETAPAAAPAATETAEPLDFP